MAGAELVLLMREVEVESRGREAKKKKKKKQKSLLSSPFEKRSPRSARAAPSALCNLRFWTGGLLPLCGSKKKEEKKKGSRSRKK